METIEDIVREMRERSEAMEIHGTPHGIKVAMQEFADRIEAAVKSLEADRDNWRRQALDEDARANATHKDSLQVGNAAKMLETLKSIKQEAETTCEYMDYPIAGSPGERGTCLVVPADWIIDECNAALAKPPRNCDVHNTEDEAWNAFCKINPSAICPSDYWSEQYQTWLFAKAKGEAK